MLFVYKSRVSRKGPSRNSDIKLKLQDLKLFESMYYTVQELCNCDPLNSDTGGEWNNVIHFPVPFDFWLENNIFFTYT